MVVCPGPYPWYQFLHSIVTPQSLTACSYMETHFWRPQKDRLRKLSCMVFKRSSPPVSSAKTVLTLRKKEETEFCFFFSDSMYSWELEWNGRRVTRKKPFFRCDTGIFGEKNQYSYITKFVELLSGKHFLFCQVENFLCRLNLESVAGSD